MHQIGSLDNEAELLQLHFQQMLVAWGSNQPPRNGLHASSLLVSDNEWCTRRYVLADLFQDEAINPALQPWDWKRQDLFAWMGAPSQVATSVFEIWKSGL